MGNERILNLGISKKAADLSSEKEYVEGCFREEKLRVGL